MKSKMCLCFVLNSLGSGGAERVATTLMNTAVDLGYDVTCVVTYTGPNISEPYKINPRVKLYRIKECGNLNTTAKIWHLRSYFQENNFNQIISFLTNVNLLVIFSLLGNKMLTNLSISERIDKGKERLSILYTIPRFLFYRLAKNLVVQNEFNRRAYRYYHHSIYVISNPFGLDLDLYNRLRLEHSGQKNVIMVGRLTCQKGYDEAINILGRYNKTCKVCIYGEGPEEESLRLSVERNGLVNCTINGLSDRIEEVYAKGRILFHNAQYEGFPNVVLEAAVLGLTCVVFNSGDGVRLLSKHFKNVYLFNTKFEAIDLLNKVCTINQIERRPVDSHPFDRYKILQKWLEL